MAQSIVRELGNASQPVVEIMTAMAQAISDELDQAQAIASKLAEELQIAISGELGPAAAAVTRLKNDLGNAIRQQLTSAAEYTSAAVETPVILAEAAGITPIAGPLHPSIPIYPEQPNYGRTGPAIPGMPGTVNPQTPTPFFPPGVSPQGPSSPSGIPGSPAPNAPTAPRPIFAPPGVPALPGTVAPSPGVMPTGPLPWGMTPATGPAASAPGATAPGGVSGPGSGVRTPDGKTIPDSLSQYYDATMCKLVVPMWVPGWQDANPGGWNVIVGSNSVVYWLPNCGGASPTPTPTPSILGPQTPTSPPTPPPPTRPPEPPPGPVPPWFPTPTPPLPYHLVPPPEPGPLPTEPPFPPIVPPMVTPPIPPLPMTDPNIPLIPQTPLGPPGPEPPPTTPCPPGFLWSWTGYQYECVPIPPPPPPPPPPIPPEEPLPPTVTVPPSPKCGLDKHHPCWVASNPPDEDPQDFYVMEGLAHKLVKDNDHAMPKGMGDVGNLKWGFAVVQGAADPNGCSYDSMVTTIDPGADVQDLLSNAIDLDTAYDKITEGMSTTAKMFYWPTLSTFFLIYKLSMMWFGFWINMVVKAIQGAGQCLVNAAISEATFNVINFLAFGALRKHRDLLYKSNDFQCPTGLPSPDFAAAAWLGNEIDICQFETYVRVADQRWPPYLACTRAGKMKFSALELMTLEKRSKLSRGDIASRLRELGSLESQDSEELEALFEQLPGPSDIVRFMQRDTINDQIVTTFELDKGFGDNFKDQLKTWADEQGVSEDYMRHNWRAHWDIPSPTQLYVMLHRLRHGADPNQGANIESDVRLALKQQDILPYWIDRYLAISYHPLTRTDLFRSYEKGWIDDDTLVRGMYDNGYSDDNAQTLLRTAQHERTLAIDHAEFVAAYADGYIDEATLRAWAERLGYEGEVVDTAFEVAQLKRQIQQWRHFASAIGHQYKACRISEDEAREDASSLGIPDEVIDYQLQLAGLNTTCGSRREMVGSLCTALDQGIITAQEYVARMQKLKYDETAINTYLQLCQNKIAARKAKQAAAAIKAEQQAERRAEREAEKEARQAEAAARRLGKQLATAEQRRQRRDNQLANAASKLGQYLSDVDGPPAAFVDRLWRLLQSDKNLSQDQAAHVLVVTSSAAKGMTQSAYAAWAMEAADSAVLDPYSLFAAVPATTNGYH